MNVIGKRDFGELGLKYVSVCSIARHQSRGYLNNGTGTFYIMAAFNSHVKRKNVDTLYQLKYIGYIISLCHNKINTNITHHHLVNQLGMNIDMSVYLNEYADGLVLVCLFCD